MRRLGYGLLIAAMVAAPLAFAAWALQGNGESQPAASASQLNETAVLQWLREHPDGAARILRTIGRGSSPSRNRWTPMPDIGMPRGSRWLFADGKLYVRSGVARGDMRRGGNSTIVDVYEQADTVQADGPQDLEFTNAMGGFKLDTAARSIIDATVPLGTLTEPAQQSNPSSRASRDGVSSPRDRRPQFVAPMTKRNNR